MIVFEKQFLKAFHNIEHEAFRISMEIVLPSALHTAYMRAKETY